MFFTYFSQPSCDTATAGVTSLHRYLSRESLYTETWLGHSLIWDFREMAVHLYVHTCFNTLACLACLEQIIPKLESQLHEYCTSSQCVVI